MASRTNELANCDPLANPRVARNEVYSRHESKNENGDSWRVLAARRLNENNRLRHGNLEAFAAARIAAGDHVIDPHHVIARLREACAIHL